MYFKKKTVDIYLSCDNCLGKLRFYIIVAVSLQYLMLWKIVNKCGCNCGGDVIAQNLKP